MSHEKIGLSRMWTRAAAPTRRTTFSRAGVALMSGRVLPAWPGGEVALRRVGSAASLDALARHVQAAERSHPGWVAPAEERLAWGFPGRGQTPLSGLAAGPSQRGRSGWSERLVAALTGTDVRADLLGFMVLNRRVLSDRSSLKSGEALLVDLEVDIDWLHVLPAVRGLGYGHALGAALVTTVVADVRRMLADLSGAVLPTSICVSVAGASRSAAVDAIVSGAVTRARMGLEALPVGSGSSVVDIRLTDREFIYLVPEVSAESCKDMLATETPRR